MYKSSGHIELLNKVFVKISFGENNILQIDIQTCIREAIKSTCNKKSPLEKCPYIAGNF